MEFEAWMRQVDRVLISLCGMVHRDLPDYTYRESFDAGEDPEDVVRDVLDAAGYGDFVEEWY